MALLTKFNFGGSLNLLTKISLLRNTTRRILMETSETIGKISLALSQAQAEMINVYKGSAAYNYNYADLGVILDMLRQTLPKYEIALIQTPSNDGANACVTTMLSHSSGEWIKDSVSCHIEIAKGNSAIQCLGSSITYLRRYSCSAIAGLTQTDDDASIRTPDDPEGEQAQPIELVRMASKVEIKSVTDMAAKADVDIANVTKSLNLNAISDMTSEQAERACRKLHKTILAAEKVVPAEDELAVAS
jgi:hypothetical protein